MLLFKAAKLAGGLRLLIAISAPLVVSSAALLSARSVAYLAGAALGSIGVTLWPIIVTLIAISGMTALDCDAYREARRILYTAQNELYFAGGGCASVNYEYFCPPPEKVWLQTIWASQSEFATQTKSCFLIGYSYTILDGLKIEYNPFELKETFLESRAMNPFVVAGDRFRGLNDSEWKNLESVSGWDKGYWKAEQTDVECRGWNPGWSRKVK